jgi:hypothetical protein
MKDAKKACDLQNFGPFITTAISYTTIEMPETTSTCNLPATFPANSTILSDPRRYWALLLRPNRSVIFSLFDSLRGNFPVSFAIMISARCNRDFILW